MQSEPSLGSPAELHDAAEERAARLVADYGAVLDNVILSLGLTQDTAVAPVRSSPVFAACCDGTLDVGPASLYTPFAVPYVIVKRLFPISEQLRHTIAALSAGTSLVEVSVLFKHKVVQFMRCYATVAKFCPKFYLSALFEWLIAQCVEIAALLQAVQAAPSSGGTRLPYTNVANACGWVQGNVAFVLCFIRGSHFNTLLANDYEQGMKGVVDPSANLDKEVNFDHLSDVMEGLKAQLVRLEQQEDMYSRVARIAPEDDQSGQFGGRPDRFYKSTFDMLRETTWNSVTALCVSPKRVPELDTVVAPLFRIFQSVGREMDLVHWAIDKDITEGVKEANLLFRTPSTATRLLRTVFFNEEGTEFLKALIYPSLRKFAKQKFPVELDPFRLPFDMETGQREDMLKANAKFLVGVAGDILHNALKSVDAVPIQIRKFLLYARNTFMSAQHTKGSINEEGATKLVVASLFFLRFVCPAIVTPQSFGIFDTPPSPDVQRGLILLGKIIQSTASGVEFDGTKEEYMSSCNVFVKQSQGSILKLYNMLIDAQSIGVRELRIREKTLRVKKQASKREALRFLQDELEQKVSLLRDCALLVNEFGLKQSFLPMFRSGGADDESVRTVRSLIKLDVKLHEQRSSTRAEHILSKALKAQGPFATVLQNTVSDFAEYLPNDLVVFTVDEFHVHSSYSDTAAQVGQLSHPLLLLDTITAHRPSRLAAIARMLRSSCQEVWEAGIALRDLSVGAAASREFQPVLDQETPVVVVPTLVVSNESEEPRSLDSGDAYSFEDDSDTQSTAAGMGGAASAAASSGEGGSGQLSTGKKAGSKLMSKFARHRSGSGADMLQMSESSSALASSPAPSSPAEMGSKNSLAGLIVPSRVKAAPSSASPFSSPFSSPATVRKRKAFKKRGAGGIGSDEANLWAPALVLPQVLGLLHFLTVLRHTLKHARLENRILMETPDVDSVLANCIFEYSKLAKEAGSQLLALAVADPTNPEVGMLGLSIANAGVLITRSSLQLMNVDRQILRQSEHKTKADKKHHSNGDESSGGGSANPQSFSTPKGRKNRTLQKTSKTTFGSPSKSTSTGSMGLASGGERNTSGGLMMSPRENPLAGVMSPRAMLGNSEGEDSGEL